MTARTDVDPAPATAMAMAGSRRPPVVLLLASAVVLTALVQAYLVQTSFVPSAALSPTLEPGDRVLVWKVRPAADAGDVVVVDTTATARVDRSTPVDSGVVGRLLSSVADAVGVEIGRQDGFAVVGGATADEVALTAPARTSVPRDAVVGTAFFRVWPLSRFGSVR